MLFALPLHVLEQVFLLQFTDDLSLLAIFGTQLHQLIDDLGNFFVSKSLSPF